MTDVFFCTAAGDEQRKRIAERTRAWWKQWCRRNDSRFVEVTPALLGVRTIDFNRARRVFADHASTHDFYILTDDDCLPLCGESLSRGLRILGELCFMPERFAILSAWPDNCNINRWTPEGREVYEDLDVMEHVSVGGLRFCRKGVMELWPPRDPDAAGYDMIQCDYLRQLGWRVGYLQHVRCSHLGEGCSDLQTQWKRLQSPA